MIDYRSGHSNRIPRPDLSIKLGRSDTLYPVIVRATALSLLGTYPRPETNPAYEAAFVDDEALIRRTAVDHLNLSDTKRQTNHLTSALYDPVKAVRLEAARRLTEIADPQLDGSQKKNLPGRLAGLSGIHGLFG